MITGTGLAADDDAAQMVAEVRDDPAGRIRVAADAYAFGRGGRRYRPYRRAVVAFMRWQQARGVLNSLHGDIPGSPWWRAVNADLLRDTLEAKLLIQRGGQPSRPSVARWVGFFNAPSAQSWYVAHNTSIVAGYLAHAALAALEAPAERFFMNVVLVRVLYAHALVVDGDLALGRLSFLARPIGHPRSRGPQALLSMKDVLPERYPIQEARVEELINSENKLGRMVDYGVIATRVDALYYSSARALGEPLLLDLIVDGAPAYAWPSDQHHVWKPQPQRRLTSLIEFLTRPRNSHIRGGQVLKSTRKPGCSTECAQHQWSFDRSRRWESACQWTCMTAKRNAVLMPNSSTPFTACRALNIWNRDGNVNPGISNVVMVARA